MNSSSPKERTHFSHKAAIGLWHFVCTFVTLGALTILWGSPLNIDSTLIVISLISTVSFVLGFLEIQDPIMWCYRKLFKLMG